MSEKLLSMWTVRRTPKRGYRFHDMPVIQI